MNNFISLQVYCIYLISYRNIMIFAPHWENISRVLIQSLDYWPSFMCWFTAQLWRDYIARAEWIAQTNVSGLSCTRKLQWACHHNCISVISQRPSFAVLTPKITQINMLIMLSSLSPASLFHLTVSMMLTSKIVYCFAAFYACSNS